MKRLALTTDGRLTYCSCPDGQIGKGRCNHIEHQNNNESVQDFTNRMSKINNKINSGMINRVGEKIGYLTVVEQAPDIIKPNGKHIKVWRCKCECGNLYDLRSECFAPSNAEKYKNISCGCKNPKAFKDLTNQVFGTLIVIRQSDKTERGTMWECLCNKCGKICIKAHDDLLEGNTKSCGSKECMREDLTGKVFGRLTVVSWSHTKDYGDGKTNNYWKCICECGKEVIVRAYNLKSGITTSCGCYRTEAWEKYANPNDPKSPYYGGSFIPGLKSDKSFGVTGIRGVSYKSKIGKYEASITFKKHRYYLGCYDKLEDAAAIRKEAEEKIHGPFIEWWESLQVNNKDQN